MKKPVPCFVNLRDQDLLLVSEVHMYLRSVLNVEQFCSCMVGRLSFFPRKQDSIDVMLIFISGCKVDILLHLFLLNVPPYTLVENPGNLQDSGEEGQWLVICVGWCLLDWTWGLWCLSLLFVCSSSESQSCLKEFINLAF